MADKPATKPAKKTAAKPAAGSSGSAAPSKPAAAKPAPKPADSKFAKFIESKKLDGRRILSASRQLEGLRPEDRLIRLNKRRARKAEGDTGPKETRKPRSGRPVTPRALHAALFGGSVSGPTKTRILKAVNHLLEQKKQEKVDLKALF